MSITDQLLDFKGTNVPQSALEMMRLSLFDWAACGIAGAEDGTFASFAEAQMALNPGPASVIGGGRAAISSAALINGTLSHALDYDDTHFAHIGHPSVAVIPAVMALAEHVNADLALMVEAATLGVEASIFTGLWLGRDHYEIGYHQTATAGAFGAVIAGCRLLGLSREQTRHALGLGASMAAGLKSQFGTMGKPLNAGLAARIGVEATLWAQAGMTAAADGLAGPLGFGVTHHGQAQQVDPPGTDWRILSISHKFHACCHGLHATLEALSDIGIGPAQVDAIEIKTHPRWMSVCNIESPTTGLAAKFSYKQTAAMAILGQDTSGIESYTDDVTARPDIMALRERITVRSDAALSETQAEVTVISGDETRNLQHDLMAPMPIRTRRDKLRAKADSLLGTERADRLWPLAQGNDLTAFTTELGKP